MIPKKLHFVWIGDEAKRPDRCIDSWKELNPTYEVRVWGNRDYRSRNWENKSHMEQMWNKELCGVADLMRYEILYSEGGVALDADSFCLRPLEDWLLHPAEFSCWENEFLRPGLVAVGYLGSVPRSQFFLQLIEEINKEANVSNDKAWKTVGPLRLTNCLRRMRYPMTIYPSHYFIPNHFLGLQYRGSGPVFATQLWGSTLGIYDQIYKSNS
jgi:mannosyltransferase OCH1-like enzyme